MHNGIIENYLPLRRRLEARGVQFASETATEVAAQLVDYYYKDNICLLYTSRCV